MFTYLAILLTLGDLAVESGILTTSQSEMFWSYRQTLIYYAADSLVHKIVVDLSRMVRVCLTGLTPIKKEIEEGGKASRMTYGEKESLIAINQNAGKKQVAARLRSYRDCTGDNETQLTEQSLLNAIKNRKVDKSEAKHMDASFCVAQRRRTEFLCSEKEGTTRGTRGRFELCIIGITFRNPHPRHHFTSRRSPEIQGRRAGVGGD